MLIEILIRVLVGGAVVSFFAILGDMVKPKSFAGLFGAAPSVALATILLTLKKDGTAYTAIEARSMALGAIAFFAYVFVVSRCLLRARWSALRVSVLALSIWGVFAFGMWWVFLR